MALGCDVSDGSDIPIERVRLGRETNVVEKRKRDMGQEMPREVGPEV